MCQRPFSHPILCLIKIYCGQILSWYSFSWQCWCLRSAAGCPLGDWLPQRRAATCHCGGTGTRTGLDRANMEQKTGGARPQEQKNVSPLWKVGHQRWACSRNADEFWRVGPFGQMGFMLFWETKATIRCYWEWCQWCLRWLRIFIWQNNKLKLA